MQPAEQTSCVVAESLVVPRLNRIEQSLSTGQDKFLDHDLRMRALSLVHDEHHRRISMLESWMTEQQEETRASRAAVESVASGLGALTREVRSNAETVGSVMAEIRAFFVSHSASAAAAAERDTKKTDELLKRHKSLMMVGMTIAFSVAGLVAVLGALHGVFAKIPLAESIAAMIARLGL